MIHLIVNSQLYLKSLTIEDSELVLNCIQQNVTHLQKWIPWINPFSNLNQIQTLINQQIIDIETQKGLMLGLFYEDDFIGMIGLQNWDHQLAIAEIGFWIATAHARKGLMAQALSTIIQFGFDNMQIQKIMAYFTISNTNAFKLLEKKDFKLEGVLRNQMLHQGLLTHKAVMGILKEEWIN